MRRPKNHGHSRSPRLPFRQAPSIRPAGPGTGCRRHRIDVKLTLKCLGHPGTWWDFTNKTGFCQLAQLFCFVRNGTVWDERPRLRRQPLYPLSYRDSRTQYTMRNLCWSVPGVQARTVRPALDASRALPVHIHQAYSPVVEASPAFFTDGSAVHDSLSALLFPPDPLESVT